MKVDIQDDNILIKAENKREEQAIYDLFNNTCRKINGGKGTFRAEATFLQQESFTPNGKVSFTIDFEVKR